MENLYNDNHKDLPESDNNSGFPIDRQQEEKYRLLLRELFFPGKCSEEHEKQLDSLLLSKNPFNLENPLLTQELLECNSCLSGLATAKIVQQEGKIEGCGSEEEFKRIMEALKDDDPTPPPTLPPETSSGISSLEHELYDIREEIKEGLKKAA